MSPSLDHIVPLNAGGKHERANVWTVHFGCNAAKSDRTDILCLGVPPHSSQWGRMVVR